MQTFTCKICSSHEILVFHSYTMTFFVTKILQCRCGGAKPVAATIKYHEVTAWKKTGYLDDDHFWGNKGTTAHLTGTVEEGDKSVRVYCKTCFGASTSGDWKTKVTKVANTEADRHSCEFLLFCGGCARELEFGWSGREGEGKIWRILIRCGASQTPAIKTNGQEEDGLDHPELAAESLC